MPEIDEGARLAAAHEHARYCAASLARAGAEYRPLLTPIFADAAAALGNLARNGDALIADLLANDVPKALILLAKEYASEKSSSKKSSSVGDKQTPAHVALFSLGNLCAHEECRSALIKLGVRNALQQSRTSEDELLRKYALRVLAKLENS